MKNLFYCTKKNLYLITKNEDGTITFFPEEKYAGAIIKQRGGVAEFLKYCIEDERSYDEFKKDTKLIKKQQNEYRMAMRSQNATQKAAEDKNSYLALLSKYGINPENPKEGGVIDANAENLTIIMRYLQTINWGLWKLPRLTQGYSAMQHDCGGKTAVTIILDKGIEAEGKIYKKLQYGAKPGFLKQYAPVGRL